MFKKKSNEKLIEVLKKTEELLSKYDNISWHGLSPAEASMDLNIVIEQIESESAIDKKNLIMLFAPTGLIQECSIANDWISEYEDLSARFDSLIKALK